MAIRLCPRVEASVPGTLALVEKRALAFAQKVLVHKHREMKDLMNVMGYTMDLYGGPDRLLGVIDKIPRLWNGTLDITPFSCCIKDQVLAIKIHILISLPFSSLPKFDQVWKYISPVVRLLCFPNFQCPV